MQLKAPSMFNFVTWITFINCISYKRTFRLIILCLHTSGFQFKGPSITASNNEMWQNNRETSKQTCMALSAYKGLESNAKVLNSIQFLMQLISLHSSRDDEENYSQDNDCHQNGKYWQLGCSIFFFDCCKLWNKL